MINHKTTKSYKKQQKKQENFNKPKVNTLIGKKLEELETLENETQRDENSLEFDTPIGTTRIIKINFNNNIEVLLKPENAKIVSKITNGGEKNITHKLSNPLNKVYKILIFDPEEMDGSTIYTNILIGKNNNIEKRINNIIKKIEVKLNKKKLNVGVNNECGY